MRSVVRSSSEKAVDGCGERTKLQIVDKGDRGGIGSMLGAPPLFEVELSEPNSIAEGKRAVPRAGRCVA